MRIIRFLKKYSTDIIVIILIIILLYFFINFKYFWPIILPLLISVFLSYLIKPLVDKIDGFLGSRSIAILITFIFIFGILIILSIYFVPVFITEIRQLINNLPFYVDVINKWLSELNIRFLKQFNFNVKDFINSNVINIEQMTKQILNKSFDFFKLFSSNILYYILIPIISYYMLRDWSKIAKWLRFLLPDRYKKEGTQFIYDINRVLHQYIRAQLIDACIVGILSFFGFSILSIKYSALLAIFTGVGNLIPYFGPILSSIPALIIALSESYVKAILVIVFLILLQQVDSIFISPRVIGSKLGLHPLSIIIALIVSNKLFGFISMFFAIPFVAVLKMTIINLINKYSERHDKQI